MDRTSFERLEIYQLSERLGDEVWKIVMGWQPFARDKIGGQLTRAADSIGANIAEGSGRGSFKDNKRFVRIARGSLCETQHWLRRAYMRKLLNSEQVELLKPIVSELAPRLNAYLRSIGTRKPQPPESAAPQECATDNGQLTTDH